MRFMTLFGRTAGPRESAMEGFGPPDHTPGNPRREELLADTTATRDSNSSSSSPRSSSTIDLETSLQHRNQRDHQESESSYIVRVYRRGWNEMASYGKPGLKRDLANWTGVTILGTSFMITLLYVFIFVWQPKSLYTMASHNFISEQPITEDGLAVNGLNRWMEDFSRSVIPIMCHSHNDYWRPYPLFSALAAGCTGVEADVWLTEDGTELLVGHDPSELTPNRTLRSMYLDPILDILERENPEERWANHTVYDRARGIFETQPNTTLTLLIDVKTDAQRTWELVASQLEPLRRKQFLTRHQVVHPAPGFQERQQMWPGPVIVVGTGNMDRDAYYTYSNSRFNPAVDKYYNTAHSEYHDYFYDAPLDMLPQGNTFAHGISENGLGWTSSSQLFHKDDAYYASVSFNKAIGSVRTGFSSKQLATLREQIDIAQRSGLKARYWDLPSWPINYRDYVWDVLTREGVGMLSVDDLESASRRGWNQGYLRSVIWMTVVSIWIFFTSVATLTIVYRLLRKRTNLLMRQQNAIFLE